MRLLTHNLLVCNRKQCNGGYPFKVVPVDSDIEKPSTSIIESEFNPDFIRAMLSKIEWDVLVETAGSLGLNILPPSYEETDLSDVNFLKAVHDVISDFHINEADLVCSKCSRRFPISKGIPNMLLQPDEI